MGGAETYLRAAAEVLARRGHALALLHEMAPAGASPPIVPSAAGIPQWPVTALGRAGALAALAEWRPDVV